VRGVAVRRGGGGIARPPPPHFCPLRSKNPPPPRSPCSGHQNPTQRTLANSLPRPGGAPPGIKTSNLAFARERQGHTFHCQSRNRPDFCATRPSFLPPCSDRSVACRETASRPSIAFYRDPLGQTLLRHQYSCGQCLGGTRRTFG